METLDQVADLDQQSAKRLWGSYVANVVMTGCWIASINPHSTNLLYAWLVCLCDLVYIVDALTRTGKRVYLSTIAADSTTLFNYRSPFFIFEVFMIPLKILPLVPYHAVVFLELDDSWVYLFVCSFRLALLLLSGRFYVIAGFSKTRKQESPEGEENNNGQENVDV